MQQINRTQAGVFFSDKAAAEDRPPRTAATVVLTILVFLGVALVFAAMLPVAEQARATGVLQPVGGARQVEHPTGGVVLAVHVQEGAQVERGALLAELAAPALDLDLARNAAALRNAEARERALAWALERAAAGADGEIAPVETLPKDLLGHAEARLRLHLAKQQVSARLDLEAESQIAALSAALTAATGRVAMLESRVAHLEALQTRGHVSDFRVQDSRDRLEELRAEAAAADVALTRAQSDRAAARAQALQEHLGFQEMLLKEAFQTADRLRELRDEQAELRKQKAALILRAPEAGIIQSVAFPSVGEVVEPGAELFDLVPRDAALIAELDLAPSDIGHVDVGMPVTVKFDSFDYRTFGSVAGQIRSISPDSVEKPDGTRSFRVTVALERDAIGSGKLERPLRAGMDVTAEMTTEERTVLRYLLKPIDRSLRLAMSER